MSLRLRLALAGAIAVLVALGLAALGLSQLFAAHVERRAIAELGVHLDQALAGLERDAQGLTVMRPLADPRFATAYGGLYWQVEEGGTVRRSRSLWDVELALPDDRAATGDVHVHHLAGPGDAPLLVLERTVTLPQRLGGGPARIAVATETGELAAARRAFMADLAPSLGGLALVLIGAGWVQLAVGLRPLRALVGRVAALRAGKAQRMGTDWPTEVRPLAAELDALLQARDMETERARARAADLAHGLKTPLQALFGEAARLGEAGLGAQSAAIEETAHAMRRTVDRELARARTAVRAPAGRADSARVTERIIAVLQRTPAGDRVTWHNAIAPRTMVALHEADLAEALGALGENAARHARSAVTFAASRGEDGLHVTVTDDGPGIPADLQESLMRRHVRADEGGTGLGLSIAADIAATAGGTLKLDNGPDGGLVATLVLPQPDDQSP